MARSPCERVERWLELPYPWARKEVNPVADLLFVVVTIASFLLLIAFAYACDKL